MQLMLKKAGLLVLCLLLIGLVTPVDAGSQVLSDNSGDGNAPWHISGESSVVINGFDLNSLGVQRPAVIDKVSISVNTPVPGSTVTVVVYQDANGGSPVDATLAGSQQVDITSGGNVHGDLHQPDYDHTAGCLGWLQPSGRFLVFRRYVWYIGADLLGVDNRRHVRSV